MDSWPGACEFLRHQVSKSTWLVSHRLVKDMADNSGVWRFKVKTKEVTPSEDLLVVTQHGEMHHVSREGKRAKPFYSRPNL